MSALAYFVSPHGFGHAARASAVMAALARARPDVDLHVFTTVPRWFFDDSLADTAFSYYPLRTDVGFAQSDPFVEDLGATVTALTEFWDGMPAAAAGAAATLERHGVGLVVADIAPLGLLAAARAGRPGVLVENFTWDWIYRGGYTAAEPRLERFARANEELFAGADLRVQTAPICQPLGDAVAVPPVARAARRDRAAIRRALGLDDDDDRALVLLTMGGMGWRAAGGSADSGGDALVVTLGGVDALRRSPGRLALPDRSPLYPPDLVAAADLVVAKLGYSTVAECWRSGARLAFLERPRFAESDVLADFARRELGAVTLDRGRLEDGSWRSELPTLLARPRPSPAGEDGAERVAALLLERLA